MKNLPRGIDPELLLSQVRNTMPYLFDEDLDHSALGQFIPSSVLRNYASEPGMPLSHFEYFRLCLSSHYLTCATPVPTDVDNQIRRKLWPAQLPLETALEMSQLVIESRNWDFSAVSRRFTFGAAGSPWENQSLGGHMGEWFTVSVAAYCALKQYKSPEAQTQRNKIYNEIQDEVNRHSEIFGSLWRAKDGIGCLKTAANLAHNLGDLDRVMDMWELSVDDPLRLNFYKLTALPFDPNKKLRYLGRLWVAGELYKTTIDGSSMAFENHRHFALRKPRCLRRSPLFLVPNGPFFDDWGKQVAFELKNSTGDTTEVVDALAHGWIRIPKTIGYGRALKGMAEILPGLDLSELVKVHHFRKVLDTSKELFEKKWNEDAIAQMDEIPSRA